MLVHAEITAAAVVALVALLGGVLMTRLNQSAIVGYIMAGVILGPSGYGIVGNRAAVGTLAEFGVLMLLFVVGMELNLRRFVTIWRVAVLATLVQIGGSLGAALLLSGLLGWSTGLAVVIGFVVAISSTAVVIKTLQGSGELSTAAGRVTIGILIAQDMAVVPMMLVLSGMTEKGLLPLDIGKVLFSILFLVGLLWFLIRRKVRLPLGALVGEQVDLMPLAGLAWCFGGAALSGLLDLSPAYGAFLAGVVLGNSTQRSAMIQSTQPIQSVLMMVFFLSIGLLLDVAYLWANLATVLLVLLMVTVFKTALNIGALRLLGQDWPLAFLVGASLAQIGEFSFLLARTGAAHGIVSPTDARLVVSVTALSLVISPFWLLTVRRLHGLAESGITRPRELLAAVYGRETGAALAAMRRLLPGAKRRHKRGNDAAS